MKLVRVNAYFLAVTANTLESDLAADKGKQRIVRTTPDIFARMNVCASLANENVASQDKLTVGAFDTQSLGLGITSVTSRTNTLFMSEELHAKS